jgi:hypothetical protein
MNLATWLTPAPPASPGSKDDLSWANSNCLFLISFLSFVLSTGNYAKGQVWIDVDLLVCIPTTKSTSIQTCPFA